MLLADRHHGLRDSVRGLLETTFDAVIMVADEASLFEGVQRLMPSVVVLDLSLAAGDANEFLARIAKDSPASRILVLSVHDEPAVINAVLEAGAHAVVLKRSLATDLLPAVESLRAGLRYVSSEIGQ